MPLRRSHLKSVEVLFEDDDFIAVNKPYGMPVHGGAGPKRTNLLELLTQAYDNPISLSLVHRLDAETTGVILIAKNDEAASIVRARWAHAEKRYTAIVHGRFEGSVVIEAPLTSTDGRAQEALTFVEAPRVLESLQPTCSWLQITLGTGRKHQIRRHLAERGYPVVGDDRHGDFTRNRTLRQSLRARGLPGGRRLFLHAARLSLSHPRTEAEFSWDAPIPPRFLAVLEAGGINDIASPPNPPLT